jgi:hypothetical protein
VTRALLVALLCVPALAPSALEGQGLYSPNAPKQAGSPSWLKELAALPPFNPPRLADGTPNLQGMWTGPNGGDDIEEHDYVDVSSPPEETYISDPPGGRVPYQPWALAKRNDIRAGLARGWPGENGRLYTDPQTFCFYSVPRATTRGGFEIGQTPGVVLMLFNFAHYYRVIPMNSTAAHISTSVKQWMGNSRGLWEGNTLVVDVTGITDRNWLDQVGNFFSDNAHVVERFTLVAPNIIDYEATIEDPTVFTRPWKMRLPLRRGRSEELWEHACHEGNTDADVARALGYRWFSGVVPPK